MAPSDWLSPSSLASLASLASLSITLASCPAPPPLDPIVPPAPSPTDAEVKPPPPPPTSRVTTSDTAAPAPPPSPGPQPDPYSSAGGVRKPTGWVAGDTPTGQRDAAAFAARSDVVKKLFADAGVPFPPASLLFRAFKLQKELEVWAAPQKDAPMKLVATYGICRLSGDIGPKRSQGDAQVPEGFYTIHYFWPVSAYHLEMKVGYPNASDKVLGARDPGGDIMIHGACASIGCLSMSDERAEELWVMAKTVDKGGSKVHVHIFPSRDITSLLQDPQHQRHWPFWTNLKEGLERFDQTKRLPKVEIDWRGRYLFP
jgi:hypothetical protein